MLKRIFLALIIAFVICAPVRAQQPPTPTNETPNVPSSGKGEWTPIHIRYAYAPGLAQLFISADRKTKGVPLTYISIMSPLEQSILSSGLSNDSFGGGNGGGFGGLSNNNGGGFGQGFGGGNQRSF